MNVPSVRTLQMLRRLDVDELIAAAPGATVIATAIGTHDVREMALAGAHKARMRLGIGYFTGDELAASSAWLKEHRLSP